MGAKVRLRFLRLRSLQRPDTYDEVWIYDGDNTGATKLVDEHSGSMAPPAVVLLDTTPPRTISGWWYLRVWLVVPERLFGKESLMTNDSCVGTSSLPF